MSRLKAAWSWMSSTPLRAALAAVVVLLALGAGVAFATAVSGLRERAGTAQASSASPSPATSPSPTASPTDVPSPTDAPSPTPMTPPPPTTVPTDSPSVAAPESLEDCAAFEFPAAPVSIGSLAELNEGILGTWVGCSITPWVPPYPVTVTFRDDGTYSARALVPGEPAFYYGTDDDSPEKLYALHDLQDDLKGVGQIDIVFWEGNINRGELRNIELMGDQLQFEFFHRGQYGPLTYRLYRVDPSS